MKISFSKKRSPQFAGTNHCGPSDQFRVLLASALATSMAFSCDNACSANGLACFQPHGPELLATTAQLRKSSFLFGLIIYSTRLHQKAMNVIPITNVHPLISSIIHSMTSSRGWMERARHSLYPSTKDQKRVAWVVFRPARFFFQSKNFGPSASDEPYYPPPIWAFRLCLGLS